MSESVKIPTMTGPVKTVGDMMTALETHIQDVLAGRMTEAQARMVHGFRKSQLNAASLQLQYARIFRGRTPDPVMRLIQPADTVQVAEIPSRLTPEEAALLEQLQAKARG